MPRERILITFLVILCGLLAATAVSPYDRVTWFMEVAPVLIALPILVLTYRRFPLTPLLYILVFLHAIVLITGGAYTYARVPLGFWFQDLFLLSSNNYDRIGHFFQGFVPALARGRPCSGADMFQTGACLHSLRSALRWRSAPGMN